MLVVEASGFRSGFRLSDLGFLNSGLGIRVLGFRFRVSSLRFREGWWWRYPGLGFQLSVSGFRILGFGFRDSDIGAVPEHFHALVLCQVLVDCLPDLFAGHMNLKGRLHFSLVSWILS